MAGKSKSQDKNKVSEIDDQIYKNFEIKKRLGKGAYGIVWKAIDKKSSNIVAVKKIFDAFRNETDAQRTFREIMFLKAFKDHPNVIQLYSIHKATNNLDIYLAFEFMESDLHNVIKRGTILKDIHKRYVMYQLFNAIKYIHSGNVIHRDLKPSNVLIDSKCRCKIADFGLARSVSNRPAGDSKSSVDPTEPILTDYVATRWYRAPEILIASKRYTKGIDMWSLGCILGEMIRGKPLFPGSSTVNQIEKIVASLPEISEKDIEAVGAGFGSVLLNQPISSENNLRIDELLTGSTEDAKHLVKSLLMLNPAERLTAKEALTHRYIEKFKNSITEAELNSDVLPPFRDDIQLTVPEYRSKLYEIMQTSEMKGGTEKNNSNNNSNSSSGKTTSKTTVRRKETPKLESSITVTATSKQSSIKISPSKLEDKSSKKEYNHTRFTEKKYQTNSISTSTNTNPHHHNSNNNSNINSNNNNNNNNIYVNSNSNSNTNFNGINNISNNGISISNPVKPPTNSTASRKQYIIYKETGVSNRGATNSNSNTNITNNNHNNINNNNSSSNNNNNNNSNNNNSGSNVFNNSNLLSNDAKLLKPLSKLKHFKLSTTTIAPDKPKMVNSPSSVEYSSSVLENGNSKYRNINNFEKRHSIDCTYHPQGISPNKHQSNTSAKSGAKNSSFSNLNTLNPTKGLINKTSYNNRLALERECFESTTSKNNQLYHHGYRKKSDLTSDTLLPSSNTLLNDTNDNNCTNNNNNNNSNNNNNNTNNNYYEKRLKLLEEKIQKQKLDIKALFHEKEKNKMPKPALDLNDYKTNDNNNNIKHNVVNNSNNNSSSCNINNHSNSNNISRKLNSSSYTISENNQDKYLRSKFTIAQHHDKIYNNKRNPNTINRTQIPIKYDIGHPDGNHMINLKEKNYTTSYENNNTNNIRKTQSIIS